MATIPIEKTPQEITANPRPQTTVAQLYDLERTYYYQAFLREMLKSIYEDGVNVIGALGWSFVYALLPPRM